MKSTLAVTVLSLLVIPAIATAGESEPSPVPADTAGQYVVRKGDTLWDLSGVFLESPFSWRELWKRNEFIHNPDLIFPGQILTIGMNPVIPAAPDLAQSAPAGEDTLPDVLSAPDSLTASPEPAQTSAVSNISKIAAPDTTNVLRMLPEPRAVFTAKNFMRTGFIAKQSSLSDSRILRIEGVTTGAIRYDTVVADIGSDSGTKEGDLFAVIAVGDRVKHPNTGVNYGRVMRVKGVLKVISVDGRQARCTVTETFDPLAVDDRVMTYTPNSGPLFDAWVRPDTKLNGIILAANEPMISIHTDDILYIDRGERHGVHPGDMFTVYRRVKSGQDDPHTPLGVVEAVSVMPGETAVIVTALKGEMIHIGDRVELSARCRVIGE